MRKLIPLDQPNGWLLPMRTRFTLTERAAIISAVKGNRGYNAHSPQHVAFRQEIADFIQKTEPTWKLSVNVDVGLRFLAGGELPQPAAGAAPVAAPAGSAGGGKRAGDGGAEDEEKSDGGSAGSLSRRAR